MVIQDSNALKPQVVGQRLLYGVRVIMLLEKAPCQFMSLRQVGALRIQDSKPHPNNNGPTTSNSKVGAIVIASDNCGPPTSCWRWCRPLLLGCGLERGFLQRHLLRKNSKTPVQLQLQVIIRLGVMSGHVGSCRVIEDSNALKPQDYNSNSES